jgi:hypothetical protein
MDEFVYHFFSFLILARTANPNYTHRDCQIRTMRTSKAAVASPIRIRGKQYYESAPGSSLHFTMRTVMLLIGVTRHESDITEAT